jgi:hypothetical protein
MLASSASPWAMIQKALNYFTRSKWLKLAATGVLSLVAIVYLTIGFYYQAIEENQAVQDPRALFLSGFSSLGSPGDFQLRRVEAKMFMEKINPYDVFDKQSLSKKTTDYNSRLDHLLYITGTPTAISGYPLWSFPIFVLVFTPFLSCEFSRFIFAFINLGALLLLYRHLYHYAANWLGRIDSHLVCLSCLALNAWYITLHNGQISILLAAGILLSLPHLRSSFFAKVVGNILLSLKFTFGFYPLVVVFFRFKWQTFFSALCVFILWGGAALWLQESPFLFLRQMFLVPTQGSIGLPELLAPCHLPKAPLLLSFFILGFFFTLWIVFFHRSNTFTKCALSLLLMRVFCYHQTYDNVMVFLAIGQLGIRALQTKNVMITSVWLATTLVFILPSSVLSPLFMPWFYNAFCILAFVTIYISEPSPQKPQRN